MDAERRRIEEVYAAREESGKAALYDPDRPEMRMWAREIEGHVTNALRRFVEMPLDAARVLDVGCGSGFWLRKLESWGGVPSRLVGLDLLIHDLQRAKSLKPRMNFLWGSGDRLPFRDGTFDVVMQFTVFTSILDRSLRRGVANEMWRVLAPGGLIVWYDFRYANPLNPDVRAIESRELRSLFDRGEIECKTVTLLPPLARRMAPRLPLLCHLLIKVPFLRSHLLAFITKR